MFIFLNYYLASGMNEEELYIFALKGNNVNNIVIYIAGSSFYNCF